jgi:hypothetical protein
MVDLCTPIFDSGEAIQQRVLHDIRRETNKQSSTQGFQAYCLFFTLVVAQVDIALHQKHYMLQISHLGQLQDVMAQLIGQDEEAAKTSQLL